MRKLIGVFFSAKANVRYTYKFLQLINTTDKHLGGIIPFGEVINFHEIKNIALVQ